MARFIEQFPVGNGKFETVDKTPHSLLTGIKPPKTLEQTISEILHIKLNKVDPTLEPETYEESMDFGPDDDDNPSEWYGMGDDVHPSVNYWTVKKDNPPSPTVSEGAQSDEKIEKEGEVSLNSLDDYRLTDTGTQNRDLNENIQEQEPTKKEKTTKSKRSNA